MPTPITIHGKSIKPRYLRLPYNPKLKDNARALRKARNFPEVLFWIHVGNGQFHQIDFDRQRVIGNYIVDFYIKSLGIVIEIDGSSHEKIEHVDEVRENWLKLQGCHVIRFTSEEVLENTQGVFNKLEEYILKNFEN